MRRALVFVFAVACSAGVSSTTTAPTPPTTSSQRSSCADEYVQIEKNWATYMPRSEATSPFKHCPHWHRAMPEACDSPTQPSFVNPCECLCDLCEKDSDCGAHESCVALSSSICGSTLERVCVREDDVCHPKNRAKCPTGCMSSFGTPKCISREDARVCR